MTLGQALLGFAAVAALITIAPGLDTALVLRSTLTRGWRTGALTAAGISAGVLVWGSAAALGVTALLSTSLIAYDVVRSVGAAYLMFLGIRMVIRVLRKTSAIEQSAVAGPPRRAFRSWATGFTTNMLNPKIGIFYIATIPQFLVPSVAPLEMGLLLAAVHVALGLLWLGTLIAGASSAARWLRRPAFARAIDGITGGVLIALGLRTAVESA